MGLDGDFTLQKPSLGLVKGLINRSGRSQLFEVLVRVVASKRGWGGGGTWRRVNLEVLGEVVPREAAVGLLPREHLVGQVVLLGRSEGTGKDLKVFWRGEGEALRLHRKRWQGKGGVLDASRWDGGWHGIMAEQWGRATGETGVGQKETGGGEVWRNEDERLGGGGSSNANDNGGSNRATEREGEERTAEEECEIGKLRIGRGRR